MSPREAGKTAQGPAQQLPGGPDTITGPVTDTGSPQLPGTGPSGGGNDTTTDPTAGTPVSPPIQQGPMGINPNQVTTKPRQMPGSGGGPMDFNPAMNGSDQPRVQSPAGAPADSAQTPPSTPPPVNAQAVRRAAKAIWEANPSMSPGLVHRLAVRAVRRYHKSAATAPPHPEGKGHPMPPRRPAGPSQRSQDEPMSTSIDSGEPQGQPWYQVHGQEPQNLANTSFSADNTLWQERGR